MSEKKYRYIKTEPAKTVAGDKQIQDNMRKNNWLALTYLISLNGSNGDISGFKEENQQIFRRERKLFRCGMRTKLQNNLIALQQNWDKAKLLPVIRDNIFGSVKDEHLDFDLDKCCAKYMELIDSDNPDIPNVKYFDTHQMIMDFFDEDGNIVNNKELQKQMCEELTEFITDLYERSVEKKSEDESE